MTGNVTIGRRLLAISRSPLQIAKVKANNRPAQGDDWLSTPRQHKCGLLPAHQRSRAHAGTGLLTACQPMCKLARPSAQSSLNAQPRSRNVSERMSQAPVYYALAQAQFNPVAAMSKYIDQIQDTLRKDGFTLYEPQQITHLQLTPGLEQGQGDPMLASKTSWLISKSDRTAGFILNTSSIAFHTTHYETHKHFIPQLLHGLATIHKIVSLEHVSRLGLRYLDAILPEGDETVDQYLASGLHGVDFDAEPRYSLSESAFNTNLDAILSIGTLVARIYRLNSVLGFPPDMIPSGLVQMERFAIQNNQPHAIIDTDHFVEGIISLDLDIIENQLMELHQSIKHIFSSTVTDFARKKWS